MKQVRPVKKKKKEAKQKKQFVLTQHNQCDFSHVNAWELLDFTLVCGGV